MRIHSVDDVWEPKNAAVKQVVDHDPVNEVLFTLRGQHDFTYDDIPAISSRSGAEFSKEACAKKNGHKYYLRMNIRGEIYNPLDFSHTSNSSRVVDGLPFWKYIEVSYTDCFAHYAHFLKNRDIVFFNLARRGIGSSA
mgnify:CR=1 FL=1